MLPDDRQIPWRDEIVEEVRRIRQQQAARFGYNAAAIVADARTRQQAEGREVVSFARSPCGPVPQAGR